MLPPHALKPINAGRGLYVPMDALASCAHCRMPIKLGRLHARLLRALDQRHDYDAVHCKACGFVLNLPNDERLS
jgi:hypothetical protein